MVRFKLVRRKISSSGRRIPEDCVEKINDYLDGLHSKVDGYELNEIFNFDESSFYMDMPGNYSIERKGINIVFFKTSGKEKTSLSCLFTADASGKKLPLLFVVPRRKKNRRFRA